MSIAQAIERPEGRSSLHPRGTWYGPHSASVVDAGRLMDEMARKSVVLLGETHDCAEIHRWQLHVSAALHARRPDMAMGFEMFPRRLQPVLDRWVAGELDTDSFLVEVEWFDVWGFDPEPYLPLFHFCRQNRVRMLALNCYRALVTRVRKEGWPAIPEAERDGLTPSAPATQAYRQYLADILGSMPGRSGPPVMDMTFDGFVAAQQTWDRAFAVNIAKALDVPKPPLVVGIIGRGHLEFGHGTPYQLRDLGIEDQAVLLTRTAADDDTSALASGIAAGVFHLDEVEPRSGRPQRAGLGLVLCDGRIVVDKLADGSPAMKAGVQTGDVVAAVALRPVATLAEAGATLRRMPAGAVFRLDLERAGAALSLDVQLSANGTGR